MYLSYYPDSFRNGSLEIGVNYLTDMLTRGKIYKVMNEMKKHVPLLKVLSDCIGLNTTYIKKTDAVKMMVSSKFQYCSRIIIYLFSVALHVPKRATHVFVRNRHNFDSFFFYPLSIARKPFIFSFFFTFFFNKTHFVLNLSCSTFTKLEIGSYLKPCSFSVSELISSN